jgi:3'-phosphoadenosine 5'-phosphosulfate sulfotransferase (PAPS reductase)/FAD synthetase
LFDEFPNIVIGVSGGKDSTVVYNLALQVARERNRLPLKCIFVDQEAEWQATIDTIRLIMENPEVEPYWFQIPIRLFNATSTTDHWLMCWDKKEEARWMRPQESYSYTENVYGTERFAELFPAIIKHHFPDTKTCYIAGMRTEESPTRAMALTHNLTYKHVTWGSNLDKKREHYTFYPIYDWSYADVWKSILDNQWYYNKVYDAQYNHGVPLPNMRVSNVHHETAVGTLFYMQEIEGDTYQRLTQRIAGIDMAGKMGKADYFPKELPFMFKDWREYRDFLLDKLIDNLDWKSGFQKIFARHDEMFGHFYTEKMYKEHINAILTNDWEHVKLGNFERRPENITMKKEWIARKNANKATN